jgi:DNA-binding transcriptional MerR regulator
MQEKEYYTVKEIGAVLDMPESTVRYFRDRFIDFIPYEGRGRSRKYTQESIEVIRAIVEYNNAKMNAEEIEKALSARFTRVIDVSQNAIEKKAEQSKTQSRAKNTPDEEAAAATELGFEVTQNETLEAIHQMQATIAGFVNTMPMLINQKQELARLNDLMNQVMEVQYQHSMQEKQREDRVERLEQLLQQQQQFQFQMQRYEQRHFEAQQQKKPWWKFWA